MAAAAARRASVATRNGDAAVRFLQCGRVVHTIAGHAGTLGDSKQESGSDRVHREADGFCPGVPDINFTSSSVLQNTITSSAMTGDGVNDAPALKKADCGIAVSSATDAARAAAAIVLLTPGLSVIIDAIKESRRIFQRMTSYAIYRIAETLGVLMFIDAGDSDLQLLSLDGGDDRDAGAAQRRRDPVHCL